MSHQQFVELFDDFLGAAYPPAGGNRKDTGRQKLGRSLANELRRRGARRVLDCAAGTGCPSLDVAHEAPGEFEIHCCDGDATMVTMLAIRATERGIDLNSMVPTGSTVSDPSSVLDGMVVNWADLDELDDGYDYVLCRGNALIYADTWTGKDQVASENTIHDYLERMSRRVRPGGHLHVDAPVKVDLKPTIRRVLDTVSTNTIRSIVEAVEVEANTRRRWTLTFEDNTKAPVSFTRFSSLLTIGHIQAILDDLGFGETEPRELAAERDNYGVIIARKPD